MSKSPDTDISEVRERLKEKVVAQLAATSLGQGSDRVELNWTEGRAVLSILSDHAGLVAEVERLKPTPCAHEHMFSVVYRSGKPTVADYDEAITDLRNARTALAEGDSMGCRVCEDSGHGADMCHHNPLLLARKWAAASRFWQCWHCGFVATNDAEGREHFGDHDGEPPSCIKAELVARAEAAESALAASKAREEALVEGLNSLRNFVRDDGATLLTCNGVNFGNALRRALDLAQPNTGDADNG